MLKPLQIQSNSPEQRFQNFVRASSFPCVGAKSALAKHQMRIIVARDISSGGDDLRIWSALQSFARQYRHTPLPFQSLVVIFKNPLRLSETEFEQALWQRLQSLSDKDDVMGNAPDPRVSQNPEAGDFALSFGKEAFFVVGLHPQSSRPGRQFEFPTLVFNPHDQFEQLRHTGTYEKLRAHILDRDALVSGSINPMLARHGDISAARQYSGRAVEADWQCPFAARAASPANDS